MSQSGSYEAGNPGVLDIQTLTGNTGGAVGPNGAGNINIIGDNEFIRVVGNPGTNTLTILQLNSDVSQVTTVDATPTVLFPFAIPINTAVSLFCDVIGVQNTFAQVCSGFIQCSATRQAGAAVLVGSPSFGDSSNNFATAEFDIVIIGNNLVLQVTGEAATTINWTAVTRYIQS